MADTLSRSPFPVVNHSPTQVDITAASQTPNLDKIIRIEHANKYPVELWWFLACFIFLVTLVNYTGLALGYYRDRRHRRQVVRRSSEPLAQEAPIRGSINLLRLPHAVADAFRALSFRWTIPIGRSYTLNIAEVILTAAYIAICFTWALINTTALTGVKFDPHYYANIAGNIATIQFPLVVALGMKNNIISFLTGVSFDKLIYLHGMVSRVLVVLIWLHAGGRLSLGLSGRTAITVGVIRAGILACVALTLLSIVSIRPIRDRSYEFFLIVHFILGVICVLSAYFHAASLEFGQFVWPAILLWALDRFIRIVRIVLSTISKDKNKSAISGKANSPTELIVKPKLELLSTHFLRLTIPAPRFFHWRPGQSVYLTFPGVSKLPLEAHPFTIATIDMNSEDSKLTFFVRVREGATKRLADVAETGKDIKVLLDGPYSSPPPLVGYDSVLLIAGGSGVSFTLPLFLDLLQRVRKNGPVCRRLTFAWTVRHIDQISWIQTELLEALQRVPPYLTLGVHIFVTGKTYGDVPGTAKLDDDPEDLDDDADSAQAIDEKSGDNKSDSENGVASTSSGFVRPQDLLALPMVRIHEGRVDLDKFLQDELRLTKETLSVNVCGTHALATAVRKAVRYPRVMDVLRGGPTISLHIEAFGSS